MPQKRYPGRHLPKKKQREALSSEKPVDEALTCVESSMNEASLLRRSNRNRQHPVEEESETLEAVSRDDCEVRDDFGSGDDIFEEEMMEEFDEEVRDEAREQGDVSDDDSGNDIWEEEKFPELLSHRDDEGDDEIDGGEDVVENEERKRIIKLGKTFNSP